MKSLLNLRRYPLVLLFVIAGLCAVLVAMVSIDLVRLANANFDYLSRVGVMGLVEGGLLQLLGLTTRGLVALAGYFLFRLCEAEVSYRYRRWLDSQDG